MWWKQKYITLFSHYLGKLIGKIGKLESKPTSNNQLNKQPVKIFSTDNPNRFSVHPNRKPNQTNCLPKQTKPTPFVRTQKNIFKWNKIFFVIFCVYTSKWEIWEKKTHEKRKFCVYLEMFTSY